MSTSNLVNNDWYHDSHDDDAFFGAVVNTQALSDGQTHLATDVMSLKNCFDAIGFLHDAPLPAASVTPRRDTSKVQVPDAPAKPALQHEIDKRKTKAAEATKKPKGPSSYTGKGSRRDDDYDDYDEYDDNYDYDYDE